MREEGVAAAVARARAVVTPRDKRSWNVEVTKEIGRYGQRQGSFFNTYRPLQQ